MAGIIPFSFENKQQVRTIAEDGAIWFLVNDVCEILRYRNPRRAVSLHCKEGGVTKRYTPTESGNQEMLYINEPNLYRLIARSKLPAAEKFEAWIFEEVLPSIRKTGAYIHEPAMRPAITPEQVRELKTDVACFTSGWIKLEEQWVYNHMRVAFQVAKVEHIPQEFFPLAKQLIASKREAHREFVHFICELCRWFEREVLGAGTPWTPAIQKKLTKKLKRQVILPPRVDWLALADESKKEAEAKN